MINKSKGRSQYDFRCPVNNNSDNDKNEMDRVENSFIMTRQRNTHTPHTHKHNLTQENTQTKRM